MTLYAHVAGSTVDTVSALPRLYFDGIEWHDWRGPGPWRTEPADAGWFPIMLSPRPDDTDTTTHDEKVVLVDGVPVQTWTARPWNTAEVGERDDRLARAADRAAVRALVAGINASIDEAKAAKVAAQAVVDAVAPTTVPQVWARVKDLARATRDTDNALIGAEQGVKALAKYVRDQ